MECSKRKVRLSRIFKDGRPAAEPRVTQMSHFAVMKYRSVPHPVDFFSSTGWESTKAGSTCGIAPER
jgi:hypothetical protein